MKNQWKMTLASTLLLFLWSCEKHTSNAPLKAKPEQPGKSVALPQISQEQINRLFESGKSAVTTSTASAKELQSGIKSFLSSPSDANLKKAQASWLKATLDYRKFYLFRHIGLVEPEKFSVLNRLDYQISGYPIQPGFIDAFGEYKYSGLVHDVSFPITPESLTHQHGLTDLADIVLGLHAIEFMLFNVGDKRNIEDFKAIPSLPPEMRERGFEKTTELPNNRRRDLLGQQSEILSVDLHKLDKHLLGKKSNAANTIFLSLGTLQQINTIHKAMESSLTNIMIEIGEFTQANDDGQQISTQIQIQDFKVKQRYLNAAINSVLQGTPLVVSSAGPAIQNALNKADNLTKVSELGEKPETDHWREVFSAMKDASDHLVQNRNL